LVEGQGNALQTMAAYIDLNPVRAGLVEDPKDYRFCGYAEAVAGDARAREGLRAIWSCYADGTLRASGAEHEARPEGAPGDSAAESGSSVEVALRAHRELIFGKQAADPGGTELSREKALQVLEKEGAVLPKATLLRCRVRYFTDGAILGSQEFIRSYVESWQLEKKRKHPPKAHLLRGADWQGLATIQGLRKGVFG
jgi:hypothetical protein